MSHCWYEFIVHVIAYLLPYAILLIELLPAFQEGKTRKKFVLVQQFAELIQTVAVAEKVGPCLGLVPFERSLDVFEHVSQSFLQFRGHGRRLYPIQQICNLGGVLIELVVTQFLQSLFHFCMGQVLELDP